MAETYVILDSIPAGAVPLHDKLYAEYLQVIDEKNGIKSIYEPCAGNKGYILRSRVSLDTGTVI